MRGRGGGGEVPVYYCRLVGGLGMAYFCRGEVSVSSGSVRDAVKIEAVRDVRTGKVNRVTIVSTSGGEMSFTPVMVGAGRIKDLILTLVDVGKGRTIKFTEAGGMLYDGGGEEDEEDGEFVVVGSPKAEV